MVKELVGVIGGTGLGDALAAKLARVERHEVQTPFGAPSGPIIVGTLGDRRVAFLNRHGPGHRFGPGDVPYAANIFALKQLGARAVIASGAVGSLREEIAPGDLVVVDQFIDKTFRRTGTFFGGYGAVHCEMADPTCDRLRATLLDVARPTGIRIHSQGTYVCMEGPQFSTRAESKMHRAWGGDLIGMTAMPEAKLAREAQMCYALVALASDYDCWRPHDPAKGKQTLIEEIISNLQTATDNCLRLIEALLTVQTPLVCEDCACRKALEMAVWTDPKQIDAARKVGLAPLFE
ncbi:S-methyl-5'-thioadenosine phosphorylase [Anaerobaca lacustris]|uniref:S-methyl-5'-thioadenosine phosphorylase n=1 Tax=Anaerobaca lacustris TaxID=3044600 RepID=A0AAW6U0P5_9BACT|nr:S-methyl-5'-thioadenosine phosphorylase [Sedimentisphaerales bacterium M17dextr]